LTDAIFSADAYATEYLIQVNYNDHDNIFKLNILSFDFEKFVYFLHPPPSMSFSTLMKKEEEEKTLNGEKQYQFVSCRDLFDRSCFLELYGGCSGF